MKRILVTRPLEQNATLVEALRQRGDQPLVFPLLAIEVFTEDLHPQPCATIRAVVQRLDEFSHLVFISTNAAAAGYAWIDRYWPQLPAGHWYAIGEATAAALSRHGVKVETAGQAMNSESLLQHPCLQQLHGQKVLVFRGEGGREQLRDVLQQRGARVEYCEVYRRRTVVHGPGELASLLLQGIDAVTVTSGETLQLLLDQATNDGIKADMQKIPLVVPGERVARLACEAGFSRVRAAANAGVAAMLQALDACSK